MKMRPITKLRSRKMSIGDEGVRRGERVGEEEVEGRGGHDRRQDDLVGIEPAQLLAAVEHELQGADADAERCKPEPVERQAAIALGLVHEGQQPERGGDAEGKVDEEDPAPAVVLRQPAAEDRAHDRADHDAHAPKRHGPAALLERIDLEHDRLRQRHQRGAEHALHHAEQHDLLDALGDAAQHGGDGEACDAGRSSFLMPKRAASQPTGAVMTAAATT